VYHLSSKANQNRTASRWTELHFGIARFTKSMDVKKPAAQISKIGKLQSGSSDRLIEQMIIINAGSVGSKFR